MTKKFAHVKVGFHRPNLGRYRFIALPNSKPHIHPSLSLSPLVYSLDNVKENIDEEFAYRLRSKYLEVGVVGLKQFLHHPKKAFHKQIQVLRVASLEKRVDSLHCHVDEAEKAHIFGKKDSLEMRCYFLDFILIHSRIREIQIKKNKHFKSTTKISTKYFFS